MTLRERVARAIFRAVEPAKFWDHQEPHAQEWWLEGADAAIAEVGAHVAQSLPAMRDDKGQLWTPWPLVGPLCADPREHAIRTLAASMLGSTPPDVEELLAARKYGIALADLAGRIGDDMPHTAAPAERDRGAHLTEHRVDLALPPAPPATATRDGPITAIHDPSMRLDAAGVLREIRARRPTPTQWPTTAAEAGEPGSEHQRCEVTIVAPRAQPAPAATPTPFLAACHAAGVVVATETDESRWVSVDELWRLERAGFVVVPRGATEAMAEAGWKAMTGAGQFNPTLETWRAMIRAATEGR